MCPLSGATEHQEPTPCQHIPHRLEGLRSVPSLPTEPIGVVWSRTGNPSRLRPGSILLTWKASTRGGMDVTALLGLATTEDTLAIWPTLNGD